jgi:3-deoxy-D-manno-octulosonic-acid transferase
MHRIIYSVIFYLALPVILLRLLIRSLKVPAYRKRIGERFALQSIPQGFDKNKLTLWIHAVSVGEAVASAPLVEELQRLYPDAQIVMTTMTPTGSDRVRMLFGESVTHVYIPYDLPGACNRFLDKYRPSLLILMETELWPNLVNSCHHQGVKLLLANGRLSEKSAIGYGRFATFTRSLLEKIDRIAAQATPDAQRFIDLGLRPEQIEVTGSLKFLVDVNEKEKQTYFATIEKTARPVLVAASTREGEEEKVLAAFKKCVAEIPSLLLILIPRHPERFDKARRLSEGEGFTTVKRSDEVVEPNIQVVIGDSMGEMLEYYSVATIAFVGGSLVDTGCQNVLEPAALGIPILVGPSQFNFATICKQLENADALKTVKNEMELAESLSTLIADEKARQEMGERGKQLVKENQNALPALMKLVLPLIQNS